MQLDAIITETEAQLQLLRDSLDQISADIDGKQRASIIDNSCTILQSTSKCM